MVLDEIGKRLNKKKMQIFVIVQLVDLKKLIECSYSTGVPAKS